MAKLAGLLGYYVCDVEGFYYIILQKRIQKEARGDIVCLGITHWMFRD